MHFIFEFTPSRFSVLEHAFAEIKTEVKKEIQHFEVYNIHEILCGMVV